MVREPAGVIREEDNSVPRRPAACCGFLALCRPGGLRIYFGLSIESAVRKELSTRKRREVIDSPSFSLDNISGGIDNSLSNEMSLVNELSLPPEVP